MPYVTFSQAAEAILHTLYDRIPFDLWIVTYTNGDDWVVQAAVDHGYGIKAGDVFKWRDSFCYRMTQGLGPFMTCQSDNIPVYSCAPIASQVNIGAYVGIPLMHPDGNLYGTLCAIHPQPVTDSLYDEFEFVKTQARILSTIISEEEQKEIIEDKLEVEKQVSQLDELTGVYNRRGWNTIMNVEQQRCERYQCQAAIIMLDLDGLKEINDSQGHKYGDEMIKNAASVLMNTVRSFDLVSRIGGDEFAILAVEISVEETERMVRRILQELEQAGINASIGWANRHAEMTLPEVLEQADENMYANKQKHKSR